MAGQGAVVCKYHQSYADLNCGVLHNLAVFPDWSQPVCMAHLAVYDWCKLEDLKKEDILLLKCDTFSTTF